MIQEATFSLAIHGGAGTLQPNIMTAEEEKAYLDTLTEALQAGHAILQAGGLALDAVEKAVIVLEDSELFNAGKGAVFTHEETHELDASIMDGRTQNAGAVTALRHVKNPIQLAKMVMQHSDHVMLAGAGAERFARSMKLAMVENDYFSTKLRRKQLKAIQNTDQMLLDHAVVETKKFGTVGAVALDMQGNLASATSTGGVTNKRFGRIGDTPIIGAGTYAHNDICAVSSTGYGEFFVRAVVAYDIAALMQYKGLSIEEATHEVIMKKVPALGGSGGVIAVDSHGNISMPFNTSGMYRGFIKADGSTAVKMYAEEKAE